MSLGNLLQVTSIGVDILWFGFSVSIWECVLVL